MIMQITDLFDDDENNWDVFVSVAELIPKLVD